MTILRSFPTRLLILGLFVSVTGVAEAAAQSQPSSLQVAQEVKVTLLSTNLSDGATVGEWGLSALVEVGDRCILFDAGRHPETVLRNAEELDVDLSCVTDVVLSHHHGDHNGGLITLQEEFRKGNPASFQRVHVAQGIFLSRPLPGGGERNRMLETRKRLEALGIQFIEYSEPTEIFPGVWVTGPIQRTHPEANYNAQSEMLIDGELAGDFIPESQGLSVLTPRGHVVLLGCGHAGVINTLEHVQSAIATVPIHAVIGGFHLFEAEEETLAWTAEKLASIGTENVIGAHCTGIEALYRLREGAHLTRSTAVVGAVGASFTFGRGIDPGRLAK
jgi:7,8-dihydropterin-6-yl-methyl-4-(beta-D-ribofuranosyl)aminobenzene 5'-phosphate synthase